MRAATEYRALVEAMNYTPALCDGVDIFISDDRTPAETAWAVDVCKRCPVLAACAGYASAARLEHGIWAGVDRAGRKAA